MLWHTRFFAPVGIESQAARFLARDFAGVARTVLLDVVLELDVFLFGEERLARFVVELFRVDATAGAELRFAAVRLFEPAARAGFLRPPGLYELISSFPCD